MRKVIFETAHLIPPIVPVSRIEKKVDPDKERDALRGSYVRERECEEYTRLGKSRAKEIRRSVRVV